MATLNGGYLGSFRGKLGLAVSYKLNSEDVIRTIGKNLHENPPPSLQASWTKTTLVAAVLKPMHEFLRMGFVLEAKLTGQNFYNCAVKELRSAIVTNNSEISIDFSRLLITKGDLPLVRSAQVQLIPEGFEVSWDTGTDIGKMNKADHVMLLAYFPDTFETVFIRSGAKRIVGVEKLLYTHLAQPRPAEIYLSFIAEDHSQISNSQYLGSVTSVIK